MHHAAATPNDAGGTVMTRQAAPTYRPVVLTVAGSDSGGGAGIQADIKAIEAAGCFATSAVTALTAQNTTGVADVDVTDPSVVAAQIDAVADDLAVAAVKTGMLATEPVIEVVAERLATMECPTVIDPVMVAASGDRLLDEAAEAAYDGLIEQATIVTPNADEAAVLTGIDIEDVDDAIDAGDAIVELGAEAALIKGGHWGGDRIEDVLVTTETVETITHSRVDTAATHGSGCFLASTIAAHLARGGLMRDAVATAIEDTGRSIRYHLDIGGGPGAVHHLATVRTAAAVDETLRTADALIDRLQRGSVQPILPEVGMNVGVALPHAEVPDEIAAVDGRLVASRGEVVRAGPISLGGSGHVARYLLAVREHAPAIRSAANCRFTPAVEAAMDELGWATLEVDRGDQPEDIASPEGSTMGWVAETAYGEGHPVAVFDRGAPGKEAMVRVVSESPTDLGDRLLALADAVGE